MMKRDMALTMTFFDQWLTAKNRDKDTYAEQDEVTLSACDEIRARGLVPVGGNREALQCYYYE